MCGSIVCLAAALLGVDARWPRLPDGSLQYIIQIEPQVLERLESGAIETVGSHVPPYLDNVRAYQIVIGTQKLANSARAANVQSSILTGVDTAWVPLPAGGVECRVWIHPDVLDELQKPGRVIEGKIPADVKRLSLFTISVGTKPPGPPITPPQGPERSMAWPPLPPSTVAPVFPSPDTPKVQTPDAMPSTPPSAGAPPDVPFGPNVFKPDANTAPIPVKPANHVEQKETTPGDRSKARADLNSTTEENSSLQDEDPAKPWLSPTVLFVLLVGLFASLGGNFFLLWITRDSRSRYRALLRRMADVGDLVRNCVLELERSG